MKNLMKNLNRKKLFLIHKEKGITLIALIVTIIVVLILASVSVAVFSNSNIIKKSKFAGETYQNKINEEESAMQNYATTMNEYTIADTGRDEIITPKKVEITVLKSDYKIDYNNSYVVGNILYLDFYIGKNSNFVSGWDNDVFKLSDIPKCYNILTLNTNNGFNTGEVSINQINKTIGIYNNVNASLDYKTTYLVVQGSYYIGQ